MDVPAILWIQSQPVGGMTRLRDRRARTKMGQEETRVRRVARLFLPRSWRLDDGAVPTAQDNCGQGPRPGTGAEIARGAKHSASIWLPLVLRGRG